MSREAGNAWLPIAVQSEGALVQAAAPLPSPAFGILSRKGRGEDQWLRVRLLLPPLPLQERVEERGSFWREIEANHHARLTFR